MLPDLSQPVIIGRTPGGAPVWMFPKDYLPSAEEQAQKESSRQKGEMEGRIKQIIQMIIQAREAWLRDRLHELMPVEVLEHWQRFLEQAGDPAFMALPRREQAAQMEAHMGAVTGWLQAEGITVVEDNQGGLFQLHLKRQGKILSTFQWKPVVMDKEINQPAPAS